MWLHRTLAGFSDIVARYEVLEYEVAGANSRLKARIDLKDGSQLYAREVILGGRQVKYAFHWQGPDGKLLIRWDNADHWPQLETSPHHRHVGTAQSAESSDAATLEEVLAAIRQLGATAGRP